MKKVWVLEKWETPEDLQETLNKVREWVADAKAKPFDKQYITELLVLEQKFEKIVAENPEGRWDGKAGKTDYNAFCWYAKQEMRENKKGTKFRAVRAEIKDTSTTWVGYINPVENEGVTRYLYATYR